jgi:5-carboxymethyl-2-hydroxymuconate isomerase
MPHFVLEYSANLDDFDPKTSLRAVNTYLANTGQFQEIDIKSRATQVEHFEIGIHSEHRAFIAARLALLTGRSEDVKTMLSNGILHALQALIEPKNKLHVQISVEIIEIEPIFYAKMVKT